MKKPDLEQDSHVDDEAFHRALYQPHCPAGCDAGANVHVYL